MQHNSVALFSSSLSWHGKFRNGRTRFSRKNINAIMHRSDITHSFSSFAANNDCCSHSAGFPWHYYCTRLSTRDVATENHCKGNPSLKAKGQRWEAQWAAEQCLEAGGMMFERSEFLPPQALRQAASGEVWTDWKMLQGNSWICSANRQHWQHIVVRSADVVCTARGANRRSTPEGAKVKRQCCQLLAPNAVHDCPVFGTFFKKSTESKTTKRI